MSEIKISEQIAFLRHLRYAGDNDELYFRDYLNEHPDMAEEYGKVSKAAAMLA